MKRLAVSILAVWLLAACATSRLVDEPADLVGPGRTIAELVRLGWNISPQLTPSAAATAEQLSESSTAFGGETWSTFIGKIRPGDELRQVNHNSGRGYAIFRSSMYVDEFLITIY